MWCCRGLSLRERTFTNSERRVQLLNEAGTPRRERPDGWSGPNEGSECY